MKRGLIIETKMPDGSRRVVSKPWLDEKGRGSVAKVIQGTHYSELARHSAVQFAAVRELTSIDYKVGGEEIRVSIKQ